MENQQKNKNKLKKQRKIIKKHQKNNENQLKANKRIKTTLQITLKTIQKLRKSLNNIVKNNKN